MICDTSSSPIEQLGSLLKKGKEDKDSIRTLYQVMQKVGGYNVLIGEEWEEEYSIWKFKFKKKVVKKGISISALREIVKCIELEYREMEKRNKRKK